MLILITSGTVREDNFHLLGLQLPPSFDLSLHPLQSSTREISSKENDDLSLHPLQASTREILSKHDLQGQFQVKWRQYHQGKPHPLLTFDHYGPYLFFKPRHEVKISMKRVFPRECNQKFRRSGPRRILNSSRRPAVQWRSRTAMKIILERSHVNKVSMKRKEKRSGKAGGKP